MLHLALYLLRVTGFSFKVHIPLWVQKTKAEFKMPLIPTLSNYTRVLDLLKFETGFIQVRFLYAFYNKAK